MDGDLADVAPVASSQTATGSAVETVTAAAAPARETGPTDWPLLRLTVRAREAAVALVLGFGGEVRLLEPVGLLEIVRERALAALRRHEETAGGRALSAGRMGG